MFDRELREDSGESTPEEVPESERSLRGVMDRDAAVATILQAPVGDLPFRAELESRFGTSLEGVRVRVGPEAQAAVRALGAQAATFGHDIAFASTAPSIDLVAHELAHVVQQRSGRAQGVQVDEQQAERAERGDSAAVADVVEETMPGGDGRAPELRKKAVVHDDLDPDQLEKKGEIEAGELSAAQIASAIAWNDRKWQGPQRAQLLGYLRESEASGGFGEGDVRKVARLQRGAGCSGPQCDGKIGDTTMAILLHAGFAFAFDEHAKVRASDVQLVFYPGEFEDIAAWKAAAEQATKEGAGDPTFNVYRAVSAIAPPGTGRLYVKHKGNLVDAIDCRGGPPVKLKDGTHTADPSKAGTYTLGAGKSHTTSNWYNSQIPWGAAIRARSDGEIEFQDAAGSWKTATGESSALKHPMTRTDFVDASGNLVKEWRQNDFGEKAYRVQGSPGLFVHTSPQDEEQVLAGKTPVLSHSHGCLHVNPAERKRLEEEGFLQGGVQLVIKGYDVHLLPKDMRDQMQGES
jgi:hypothetical protein